jgi:superfamily II DNA or RNA helicase
MSVVLDAVALDMPARRAIHADLNVRGTPPATPAEIEALKARNRGRVPAWLMPSAMKTCTAYEMAADASTVSVPLAYAVAKGLVTGASLPVAPTAAWPACSAVLRPNQVEIMAETMASLNASATAFLDVATGTGKTLMALWLLHRIGLRAVVLTPNRNIVFDQWVEQAERMFAGRTVVGFPFEADTLTRRAADARKAARKARPKPPRKRRKADPDAPPPPVDDGPPEEDADTVYAAANIIIANTSAIANMTPAMRASFDVVVVDEAHKICTQAMSASLFLLHPTYALGLSATPLRSDGMQQVLTLFFGSHMISRHLFEPHLLLRHSTGFVPTFERTEAGGMNWSSLIASQASCQERNRAVVRAVAHFADRHIIVLCKLVHHANDLCGLMRAHGISACTFLGTDTTYDPASRVLVGTISKMGIGFNRESVSVLMLAADVLEKCTFMQYIGRIFRVVRNDIPAALVAERRTALQTATTSPADKAAAAAVAARYTRTVTAAAACMPIVLDFVDDNSTITKHWLSRKEICVGAGAVVKAFTDVFPEVSLSAGPLPPLVRPPDAYDTDTAPPCRPDDMEC